MTRFDATDRRPVDKWTAAPRPTTSPQGQKPQQKRSTHMVHKPVNSECSRHRRHGRSGGLWEGRYRAGVVDSERYFLVCQRYIELNPVRAGMVGAPGDYRWSSYGANAGGSADPLLTPHPTYLALGEDDAGRGRAYRALFQESLQAETIEHIRLSGHSGRALGDATFRRRMAQLSGHDETPRRPGRPAKMN